MRSNPEVIAAVKEMAKKRGKPKEIYDGLKTKWPELSFGDVMSILFKKPRASFLKEGAVALEEEKKAKGQAKKQFPSTRIWVHPSVLLLYNYLVDRGFEGSFAEFMNASVLKSYGLEPLFAVDLDPELITLRKEFKKLQLQREVQKLRGKEAELDFDKEIDKLLEWYSTIKVMEGIE